MSIGGAASNNNGGGQATLDGVAADRVRPERDTVVAAADLLSHYWTRPLPDEVETWVGASELRTEMQRLISSDPDRELVTLPDKPEDTLRLLDEYERLFVGPGQVPCPPYESFWREDVPLDIRRTLMGPCTAELKELYGQLGVQLSAASGELPDHVAIVLEAFAFALSRDDAQSVARQIFEEHLARFLPRLCRALIHDAEDPFYRDLAVLSLDWLSGIRSYFAVAESA